MTNLKRNYKLGKITGKSLKNKIFADKLDYDRPTWDSRTNGRGMVQPHPPSPGI